MAETPEIVSGATKEMCTESTEIDSTQEICSALDTLNLDEPIDENNNSSEHNGIIAATNTEDIKKEVPTFDGAADSQFALENEVDGPEDVTSSSEAQADEKNADVEETKAKEALSKFRARSLGVAQSGTTFSPQSLIDVPDYGYTLDGGYQSAW